MPFQRTETIVCKVEVRNAETGTLTDPATSMNLTITDPSGTKKVDNQSMLPKDSVGKYHLDYTLPSDAKVGKWIVEYVATDGTRVTLERDDFLVEA